MSTPSTTVNCVVDRNVLNHHTFASFDEIGLWIFAPLCGKNRGAFVLNPPDGQTYGCVSFPEHFATLAGVKYDNITDSNSIDLQYQAKNITAGDAVDLIDLYVKSVYTSTPGVDRDPMGCAVNGLTQLECEKAAPALASEKIRAVTLAGVFVPAPWATGGKSLTLEEAKSYYTAQDFTEMADLGLNAVQIPVPLSIFGSSNKDASAKLELLGDLLQLAADAKLNAVVALQDDVDTQEETVATVQAATSLVISYKNVIALIVPSSDLIAAARSKSTSLNLMIPTHDKELPFFAVQDPHVYVAFDRDHRTSIADIASSTSPDDRNKLYYHEMVSCQASAPAQYAACYRGVSAYVQNGFNLAIDDCVSKDSVDFMDYGQCGRFDETVDSPWWEAHRQSFAARQLAAYEAGAGWTFDAWKLYKEDPSKVDVIDTPAKLMTLKNVAAAGLLPSLLESSPAQLACLNPPINDVQLGDDTLAPSPGPPPDCGNGWWVEEKAECEYWVPPTPSPTSPPVICPASNTTKDMAVGGAIGAAVVVVVGGIILQMVNRKRRAGYSQVPPSELVV